MDKSNMLAMQLPDPQLPDPQLPDPQLPDPQLQNIQLVVFDMAGTTVQDKDQVQRCFFEAATSTGLESSPEKLTAMMGWSKRRVFETLWAEQIDRNHPDYSTKVDLSFTRFKQILEHHYQTESVQPTEGCLELFAWLKSKHIKIALSTGFYREVTNIILHRLGWDQGLNDDYSHPF
jgi:phosphoglycolate phosphatase-like HAD superfamily hydrolase